MYLSHKYKFLFLRTPKTASSSLSDFFIRNIDDPDAIYTEVEDSGLRGTLSEEIVSRYRPYAFYHFTVQQLINEGVLTEEQAREYYTFALLRNPVDRQKSFYYFYKKFRSPRTQPSIEEYRNWVTNGAFNNDPNAAIVQADLLKIRGESIGDYWLYEKLADRLMTFMHNIGCADFKHQLPMHKTDTRKNRENEIEITGQDLTDLQTRFKDDFELYYTLT